MIITAKKPNFINKLLNKLRRRPRLRLLQCKGEHLTFELVSGAIELGENEVLIVNDKRELPSLVFIKSATDTTIEGSWAACTPDELQLSKRHGFERRDNERLPCQMRVVSKDLPGFSSIAQNIGGDGIQVLMCGAVETGTHVGLSLETDHDGLMPLSLDGEVRWCRPSGNGTHLAGICLKRSRANRLEALRGLEPRFERRATKRA